MTDTDDALKLRLDAGFLGHLAHHRGRQILLGVERAAGQLVVGAAEVVAKPLVYYEQPVVGVDHHAPAPTLWVA